MSDCCSTNNSPSNAAGHTAPNKHLCPVNGKPYTKVPSHTLSHHLKQPWLWDGNPTQQYYFCDDPACEVAYFSEDNAIINKSKLRTTIGIKEQNNDNELVCYCFGVTFADARDNKAIKDFVVDMTKQKKCACDARNPSGRCCLKDFPKS